MDENKEHADLMNDMMTHRAKLYADVHDEEVRALLKKNGLDWDGTEQDLRNTLTVNGLQLVVDQSSVLETVDHTTKSYNLKLCKIIDQSYYKVSFSMKLGDEE